MLKIVVTCALIKRNGFYLCTRRAPGNNLAGYWEFPGGKLEKNETPEMCLIRELKEEIDVDISKECIAPIGFSSFTYTHFHVVLMLYISRKWNGKILPREGNSLKWIKKTELKNLKMPEANKTLIPFIFDLI